MYGASQVLADEYDNEGPDADTPENESTPAEIEAQIFQTLRDHMEGVTWVSTFEEDGMLTRNRGLTVHLDNGGSFQITLAF